MNVSGLCYCFKCCEKRTLRFQPGAKYEECEGQQAINYAFKANAGAQPVALDAVVEANRKLLLERSNVGVAKYGVTLAGSGLSRRALLQHALEEALDLANYLQAELMREDSSNG